MGGRLIRISDGTAETAVCCSVCSLFALQISKLGELFHKGIHQKLIRKAVGLTLINNLYLGIVSRT